jgi:hypothetical protein
VDEVSVLRLLRFAALLCLLEALGVVVMAVVEIIAVDSSRLAVGLTTTVFFVVYAAGLAVAARALARIRSWARAPLLLAQLIQLGLAWSFSGSSTAWVTVLLAVPAVVVGVSLILPVTAEVLYGSSDRDDARSR